MKGALALTGSGEYLPQMEPVDRYLLDRLDEPARVVCLPTAAGTESDRSIAYWSDLGVKHFSGLGADAHSLRVIDRASAQDAGLANEVRSANFVYLSGGKPLYLYDTLNGSAVWQAITQVLESGGVVAGCSAGAMIWGERATPLSGDKGFGYLRGAFVIPHFDEWGSGWMMGAARQLLAAKLTMLGIEGYTALVHLRDEDRYQVVGTGGVTVWNGEQKRRHTDGETVSW